MPDPNAHADDMKSPANPETMPALWWLSPWTFAVEQWNARARFYRYWQVAEQQRETANAEASAKTLRIKVTEQNILDTANAAGFEASKTGYAINGQPRSHFPLNWLGEAVAYWKGEAYAARRDRDEARKERETEQKKAHDFEQRWLEANEALTKEHGEHEETQEKLRAAKASAEGHSKLVELALADKDEAEKQHAEEHKANVLLQQELAEVQSRLNAAIFAFKKPAKRKAKKKGVRRG